MKVSQALKARKSVRAFTNQAVSDALIHHILDHARCAPSGVNTQPWKVAVLRGSTKAQLCNALEHAFRSKQASQKDYQYYPQEWIEPYRSRRKACGLALYSSLGIQKEDKQRRDDQWAANYRAFDAPVVLMFLLDEIMEMGSYLDYGMFLQSVMLAATEKGLATCPQAALAEYPDIVRHVLGYDASTKVICGIALGYEDVSAKVNHYRTERETVESFTQFYE